MTQEHILHKSILVDIDALFDTRLSLLYFLNEDIAVKMIEDASYVSRKKDNFNEISFDIFNTLYRNRNKGILIHALPTPIFNIVREHYGDIVTDIKQAGSADDLYIYINMHPYELNHTEQSLLTQGINNIIPNANIKYVVMDNEELSPEWISEHLDIVIKYDVMDWIEYNTSNTKLINKPLVNVHFIAPALVPGNIKTTDINIELFNNVIATANMVVNLSLIDVIHFSALLQK